MTVLHEDGVSLPFTYFHPFCIKVGSIEYQSVHTTRMFHGKDHGDVASVGEAKQMGLSYLVCIHEAQEVVGKLPDGEWCLAPGCLPVPPGVNGKDAIISGKLIHLPLEIVAAFTIAMEEDQRLPPAFFQKEMLDVHDNLFSMVHWP